MDWINHLNLYLLILCDIIKLLYNNIYNFVFKKESSFENLNHHHFEVHYSFFFNIFMIKNHSYVHKKKTIKDHKSEKKKWLIWNQIAEIL